MKSSQELNNQGIDYELVLYDRIHVIKDTIEKYGEDKFYLSFSGGRDSTTLSHLIDMALPNNQIPRVLFNTGVEYTSIMQFVKRKAETDKRITIYKSGVNIKQMLNKYGYPFKSKDHSDVVRSYQSLGMQSKVVQEYLGYGKKEFRLCPNILRYQFEEPLPFKVSKECCHQLKKRPSHKYSVETGRTITITGMLRDEGGARSNIDCILTNSKGEVIKFHPFAKVTNDFIDWLIKRENIELCELYYPPFNFKRTGCKGCPYNPNLQEDLEVMQRLLPNERKQCELLWKPVYEEYRRIGYRLRNDEQIKLF